MIYTHEIDNDREVIVQGTVMCIDIAFVYIIDSLRTLKFTGVIKGESLLAWLLIHTYNSNKVAECIYKKPKEKRFIVWGVFAI